MTTTHFEKDKLYLSEFKLCKKYPKCVKSYVRKETNACNTMYDVNGGKRSWFY